MYTLETIPVGVIFEHIMLYSVINSDDLVIYFHER